MQRLQAELEEAEAQLRSEEDKARQSEAELVQAESELRELRDQAKELEGLEEQYWHAANHLSLSLRLHAQQQASTQRKVALFSKSRFHSPFHVQCNEVGILFSLAYICSDVWARQKPNSRFLSPLSSWTNGNFHLH